jgi:biopolymer transport protein ExbB/biopolymer transport protein TolQ
MLVENLLKISMLGATWVMYLLLLLSFITLGVILERWWFFRTKARGAADMGDVLARLLALGELEKADALLASSDSVEAEIIRPTIGAIVGGPEAISDAIESQHARKKKSLERGMSFLGTIGTNAPFIGLFGTVIGVIEAFAHLGAGQNQDAMSKVMAGIAEALVATGVGLFVAIPAAVFFNVFQQRLGQIDDSLAAITKQIAANMKAPNWVGPTPPQERPESAKARAAARDTAVVA